MRLAQASTGSAMLLAVAFLAGCGGGGNEASPASPVTTTHHDMTTQSAPSKQELAQEYLRIVAPANAALDTFNKKESSYDKNTTTQQVATDLAPVIAAYQEADNALLRVSWPSSIATDVKAMVTADGALIGDLQATTVQDVLSSGSWATQVSQDGGKSVAAANIVRADLGLAPVKP
jgi:hypothetical protein